MIAFLSSRAALILLCRRNAVGPVYVSPGVLTTGFLVTYTLNLLANIAWLFLWDNELIIYASAVLWFICLTNWIALGILHGNPPARKPLPRVRKPNLHSGSGQDSNPCVWRPLGPQSTHGSTVPLSLYHGGSLTTAVYQGHKDD
ncbi:hypothetical protein E2C01_084070 [Portunus trituberculatus]|uniref:Uncharacterized protein n=1 Tax=Portunus trituberculatus TaxID=210409 RepID=A0A5B7J6G9_PORTR|nr:hypothetical protein [Portunus trituberculatus]